MRDRQTAFFFASRRGLFLFGALPLMLLLLMAIPRQAHGGEELNVVATEGNRRVVIEGKNYRLHEVLPNEAGAVIRDMDNRLLWLPAGPLKYDPDMADARELRLRVRELVSQLLAGGEAFAPGTLAVPTSFVNQEDFSQSSPLGRFIGEQLIHEFSLRGVPVKEYRLASSAVSREGKGEFLLSRKAAPISTKSASIVFVVGTYFQEQNTVFINARLVKGNGLVLRTAQLILPINALTRRMLDGEKNILHASALPSGASLKASKPPAAKAPEKSSAPSEKSTGNSSVPVASPQVSNQVSSSVTSGKNAGNSNLSAGRTLQNGSLPIRDFSRATSPKPTNLTPFDRGEDLH